ncbi:MAG: hypothetical protein FJ109_05450 [Deltaproteobacteria bacterium]|nr:hypothetical protein [Deltaproteobacteria bacterium]
MMSSVRALFVVMVLLGGAGAASGETGLARKGNILTAKPFPTPECPEFDFIIDDQDGAPKFTLTGDDWATWGTAGCGFSAKDTSYHYLSKTVGGPDKKGTATWKPNLPVAGTYEITTWFRKTVNRSTDADHFIHDGNGKVTHLVVDQKADSPPEGQEPPGYQCGSGWYPLGTYFCQAGDGGCFVVLDGTDDDQSDEANAVRFKLLECSGVVDPVDPEPTCDFPGAGPHETQVVADSVDGKGWESPQAAVGEADGAEAHSPNVDKGELLQATFPALCDPAGKETIQKVEIGVKLRTQYDSGKYDILLKFHAKGAAGLVTHHTSSKWDVLDITGDKASWSWAEVGAVTAVLELDDHPGGFVDSDVWVDAFQLKVTYVTEQPPCLDGEWRCNGDDLELCQGYEWSLYQSCPYGCIEADHACAAVGGEPGPADVVSGPDAVLPPDVPVAADGAPASDLAPSGEGVTVLVEEWANTPAGEGACTPGTRRCSGATSVEVCSISGEFWTHYQACAAAEVCWEGECVASGAAANSGGGCSLSRSAGGSNTALLLLFLLLLAVPTARAADRWRGQSAGRRHSIPSPSSL